MASASCKVVRIILDHYEPKVKSHDSFYYTPPITLSFLQFFILGFMFYVSHLYPSIKCKVTQLNGF
jgi:hypothetical protein